MSTIPNPTGSLALPAAQVRTMVAQSRTFQAKCGVSNSADALKHISFTRRSEGRITRPFACPLIGDMHRRTQDAGGDRNFLIASGSVGLYMTMDTGPQYRDDLDSASIEAANFFGGVIDDLAELSGADNPQAEISHLPIRDITLRLFGDSDDDTEAVVGSFFYCVYMLDWGFDL